MDQTRKRRVLFVGEASFLATGFSTYWNEVIKRLHVTGEFEIAELASYAYADDPRCKQVPWKFYPVAPARSDAAAMAIYDPRVNPTHQFGEGCFNEVCLDWKPDIVCVPPGTQVETPFGPKNIEELQENDLVISHTGQAQKILRTMRRQHIGDVIKIYPHNDDTSYSFTPEHPILTIKSKKRTWKQRDVQGRHDISDAQFIDADKVSAGDYVLVPIYKPHQNPKTIDVTTYLDNFICDNDTIYPCGHVNYKNNNGIPKDIVIDRELARLLGYYCAEGSCSGRGIQFSFHKDETEYIADVLRIMSNTFGIHGVVTTVENTSDVRFNSVLLEKFFGKLCGIGAHNKQIPIIVNCNSDNEICKSFLEGLIKGDGCYKSDTVSLCTVSKKLARQVRMLFARLRIKASIRSQINKPNELVKCYRLSFDIECYGQFARMAHEFIQKHPELPSRKASDPKWIDKGTVGWITDDYIVIPIRRVRKENYSGQVYNLEVKYDNSYVTGFAVHNCSIRDWWMDEFILRSPLRKNFSFVWMPTIDGEPQRELWLDAYKQCDGILTYSNYGMDLLKRTGRRGTKLIEKASAGVDLDTFKPPEDKRAHKSRLGIDPNALIVGMTARNQKRKLYYDLIEAFSIWLQKSKSKGHLGLAKRTFLYLHTSYPDVGYDIGKAIRDFNIGNKVIMTYLCADCHTAYPAFFSGELMVCRKCRKLAAHPPDGSHSCPRNVLADIMKTFDLCVQYSICLHPDTPIMTVNGWEDVGNIVVGNEVVGKDGKLHRIYKTARHKPDRCFDIKTKGRPWSVTATDNHPWLVVDKTGLSKGIESIVNRERYRRERSIVSEQLEHTCNHFAHSIEDRVLRPVANKMGFQDIPVVKIGSESPCPSLKFIYKRTDELRPGDLLATRIPTEEILPDYDLPFMDEDMAYYLGLFAADGHANPTNGSCYITLANGDDINTKHVKTISKQICKDMKIYSYKERKAFDATINCKIFMYQLRNLLYHEDKTKQLPFGCHLWPLNLQEALIRGLMAGDGSQNQKYKWLNNYGTTSIHIAKMLGPILERLGWYYSGSITYRDGRLPMYRFDIRTDGERKSHETLYRDGFTLTKLASINPSKFDGDVVTIDVEDDHNYNTICGMSHNCEGQGMPPFEAMCCGVPVMAVDYSAMHDYFDCPTSIPIRVQRFFWEAIIETEQKRALPDNMDFVNKLDKFLKQNEQQRTEKSKQTRAYAEELVDTYGSDQKMPRYSWNRTTAIWGQVIRETPIHDPESTWLCKSSRISKPNLVPPSNDMNNSEFVNWVIDKVWNRPDMLRTHFAREWLQNLNSGYRTSGDKRVSFSRQEFVNHFVGMVQVANAVEQNRLAMLNNQNPETMNVNVTVM